MNDAIKEYVEEVLLHKQYVIEAGKILSSYLIENNNYDIAINLANRCAIHDLSKFSKEEMELLMSINDKKDFYDPNCLLDDKKIKAIEIHWRNNSHHPEFYSNIYNMTDLDLMEMACDCFARSLQYKTDFLNFILVRQQNRFKFPDSVFKKYYRYCKILDEGYKKLENNSIIEKTKIKVIK